MKIAVGILAVALVATLGDYTWYTLNVRHNVVTGIIHGAVLLTAVGAVLGLHAGRFLRGLPTGTLSGIGGALTYYVLVALVDPRTYGTAIPASWVAMWLIVALLDGRWVRAPQRRPWREIAMRGVLAAVLSGIAFFLMLNTLWGPPPATGKNYVVQFAAWVIAWAPGLLALTLDTSARAFWVFGIASAMYGLIASGIGLFNESILAERGFSADIYYRALAVTAITGLAGNFGAGAWADRGSLRTVLIAALLLLAAGLAALPRMTTNVQVYAQAVAMGVAGGFVTVVFFSFWGRAYGRTHLGRIQGVAQGLTVVASALGPLVFAWFAQSTGSYAMAFYGLAVIMVLLAGTASIVRVPGGV